MESQQNSNKVCGIIISKPEFQSLVKILNFIEGMCNKLKLVL